MLTTKLASSLTWLICAASVSCPALVPHIVIVITILLTRVIPSVPGGLTDNLGDLPGDLGPVPHRTGHQQEPGQGCTYLQP